MTEVEYTEQAIEHLEGLDPQVADRVMNKVDEATEWTDHRLESLTNYPYYKLRAGDYRAIITWDRSKDLLRVEAVGHRRNIYDRHLPP
ncbi:type II toxin-antitoxin system RelE/ParE family toxin [Halorubrum sp. 48-1-W]|uniref:type II toxin-antitoxin system RelE family toxin n=1 Tax=Halorubrum sp. 48-1-W TaxID=2249761 RepID=UPI000DCCAFD6|nr:type II toxin-antitoxin system RelE/ParE family toxin [Halorubrum sp. 48-1-W]RAW46213.1 type II toxin-antitoxin system RelE/ParE family toxin [Halorubrum sp. 48-1-W]